MIRKRRKRDFDSLAKAAKTAGLVTVGEITDLGTSVALGAVKTLQESKWEKKAIVGGIIGNIAAGLVDMDLPFINLGIESMSGVDAFVDNMSDVAMGVAGASLAYKAANNIQAIHNSEKSIEEIMADMGLEIEEEETPIANNIGKQKGGIFSNLTPEKLKEINRIRNNSIIQEQEEDESEEEDTTEEQEMLLLQKLLAKYKNKLNTEETL